MKPTVRRPNAALALVAASRRLLGSDAREERATGAMPWQIRSLNYADLLGEVWYASKFYERALRNLKLVVQTRTAPGAEWKTTTSGAASDLLAQLTDANGETSALLGMYGRHMFQAGEARLLGQVIDGERVWEMLSVVEIHVNEQGEYIRQRSPGSQRETIMPAPPEAFMPVEGGAVMFKLWQPSARFSEVPDAPMRAVLDICEELLLLTRSVRGEIRSRLAGNGLLGIPNELMLPFTEQGPRPDEDPEADGLTKALTDAAATAIQDEAAAAAMIPIILRGPGDLLNKIVHFTFAKPTSENEAKRTECIRRLALGLDMPPEILLGVMDANHWTAWQIDESSWKTHIQPVAQTLVENLTRSWLRPAMGATDANVRIWYDESEVVNHPDRSADYRNAFQDRVLSAASYRQAIGASDADAMSPEEQDRYAELAALAKRGSDSTAVPSSTTDTIKPAAGTSETPAPGGTPTSTSPETPPPSASRPPTPTASVSFDRILAAAEGAVWRSRELAGSRLRSKVERDRYAAVANLDLAHAVHTQGDLPKNTDALVAGGGAMYARMLSGWGIPEPIADQLVAACETHARDTLSLDTPLPLPDDVLSLVALGSLDGSPA